jgi:hypothetical protein
LVLCSGLLISFLFQFVPVLYRSGVSWLCTRIFTVEWRSAMAFPPVIVLFWFYLFINHILHFLFFFFLSLGHVVVLLGLATTPVRNLSLMEHLSSKLHSIPRSPPSLPTLASTLLAGTTLLRTYNCPHSALYELCIGTAGFLFGFLTIEEGTDRLSRSFRK